MIETDMVVFPGGLWIMEVNRGTNVDLKNYAKRQKL